MAVKHVRVEYYAWHRLKNAVEGMQGVTFYCEDSEGALRRWYPPEMPFGKVAPMSRTQTGGDDDSA
jgi:hypothetical protein